MKSIAAILLLCAISLASGEVKAGQAEVRDVALANNCTPKKTEVYQNSLGSDGSTIYQVQCNMPKLANVKSDSAQADTLLIKCQFNLCEMLRSVTPEKSKK